jgi:NAD(P)-dependent dehydrogenase (short-subunit alcohol dehydrogenase family)
MRLEGRHAFVTGGSRGIGRAIAGRLAENGARVTVLGRNAAALQAVVAAGEAHFASVADVEDAAALAGAVAAATARHGPVDILVANAGIAPAAPFLKTSAEIFRQTVAVNLFGVVEVARAVLAGMIERKSGRIIAIASTAGLKGYPYVTSYVASKHAVIGFVRALALETATTGVTVNAVCPGFTETDIVSESIERIMAKTGRTREAALADLVKHNPQQRLIQPQEVADTVLWLCSDGARSMTGQAISVSGGEI